MSGCLCTLSRPCPMSLTDPKDVDAVVLNSLTTWASLRVWYKVLTFQQAILVFFSFKESTVGVSTPCRVWLTSVIRPVPWLVSSPLPPMIVSLTLVSVTINFLRDGVVSPMPNLHLLPGLGTSSMYSDWTGYTQAELQQVKNIPKLPGVLRIH